MIRFTQTVIATTAIVSGVLNYEGLTLMIAEGNWWLKSLCALTGVAVTLSLSLFWSHAFATLPNLESGAQRSKGWVTLAAGLILIIGISTYWNLVAFAKDEINRLSSGGIVVQAEQRLAKVAAFSALYRAFVPQVTVLRADIDAMEDAEITGGGTSGFPSAGPISNLMGQVGDRLASLDTSITEAESVLSELQETGSTCLAQLRLGITNGDSVAAGTALSCINRVAADMVGQDVPATIKRGLTNLTTGIVRPANVYSDRSRKVIEDFLRDTDTRAKAMAAQIEVGPAPQLEPLTMARPNVMRGVLLHWQSILPAIATALSIDLLPLVLLIFAVLLADERRRKNLPARDWTSAELLEAVGQIEALKVGDGDATRPAPAYIDLPPENWQDDDDPERA